LFFSETQCIELHSAIKEENVTFTAVAGLLLNILLAVVYFRIAKFWLQMEVES